MNEWKPHKKFFEIVCSFSIDKEVSSVCCQGNMHWNLNQRKYLTPEKKDRKGFSGQWAHCMFFFRALLLWWKWRMQKQGGRETIREAVRKMEKNLVMTIVAFHSGLCLIDLNMSFRHLQNIDLENFWRESLIWYLAKPYGQEVGWKFEAITLTRESYEYVVFQAALEEGYEIENVAATKGTDFSSKPMQLAIIHYKIYGLRK